jgi:hypothetical protein
MEVSNAAFVVAVSSPPLAVLTVDGLVHPQSGKHASEANHRNRFIHMM